MIISRAPMQINLIGGNGYSNYAISAAIDKFAYVVINQTPLVNHISARYSITENVNHPKELKNERIKEALLKTNILSNIEIGSFATIPIEIGFRSNSSFTSALLNGLYSSIGKTISSETLLKEVNEIESKILYNKYSLQEIHTSISGGINSFVFNEKKEIQMNPIFLDFHKKLKLEEFVTVYYIRPKIVTKKKHTKIIKVAEDVSNSAKAMVEQFSRALIGGNIDECAFVLHKNWMLEKSIDINKPPKIVNDIYEKALSFGALGGKFIGDETGGCLILLGEDNLYKKFNEYLLLIKEIFYSNFKISFVQSGVHTIFKLKA